MYICYMYICYMYICYIYMYICYTVYTIKPCLLFFSAKLGAFFLVEAICLIRF